MKIAVIGAPGAGKSTVGPLLAERLGLQFTDADAEIERRENRLIREIFATEGEPAFRTLERDVTLELLNAPGVISLGGGAPMTPEIAEALSTLTVIWLGVNSHHALKRIGIDSTRPILAGGGVRATLIKLLNERTPTYQRLATVSVDTSGQEAAAVVEEILRQLSDRA
ncbi:MAG: shikimate kinase [Propioniciclava sp.]